MYLQSNAKYRAAKKKREKLGEEVEKIKNQSQARKFFLAIPNAVKKEQLKSATNKESSLQSDRKYDIDAHRLSFDLEKLITEYSQATEKYQKKTQSLAKRIKAHLVKNMDIAFSKFSAKYAKKVTQARKEIYKHREQILEKENDGIKKTNNFIKEKQDQLRELSSELDKAKSTSDKRRIRGLIKKTKQAINQAQKLGKIQKRHKSIAEKKFRAAGKNYLKSLKKNLKTAKAKHGEEGKQILEKEINEVKDSIGKKKSIVQRFKDWKEKREVKSYSSKKMSLALKGLKSKSKQLANLEKDRKNLAKQLVKIFTSKDKLDSNNPKHKDKIEKINKKAEEIKSKMTKLGKKIKNVKIKAKKDIKIYKYAKEDLKRVGIDEISQTSKKFKSMSNEFQKYTEQNSQNFNFGLKEYKKKSLLDKIDSKFDSLRERKPKQIKRKKSSPK